MGWGICVPTQVYNYFYAVAIYLSFKSNGYNSISYVGIYLYVCYFHTGTQKLTGKIKTSERRPVCSIFYSVRML